MIKIAKRYGLIMMVGFISFFLLMYGLGLAHNYWLRLFFIVIHLSVLTLGIHTYRQSRENSIDNHVSGVAAGMATSFVGVLGFCIFLFLFLTFESDLMTQINSQFDVDRGVNPVTASAFMFVEGISAGLIGSYILTRLVDSRLSDETPENSIF